MKIDITPLCEALITLFATLITVYLIPWIKAHTTNAQQEQIRSWVQVAVYAAEKLYGAGHGEEKLSYAVQFLSEKNIELDSDTLTALINSTIKEMEQAELPEEEMEVQ